MKPDIVSNTSGGPMSPMKKRWRAWLHVEGTVSFTSITCVAFVGVLSLLMLEAEGKSSSFLSIDAIEFSAISISGGAMLDCP